MNAQEIKNNAPKGSVLATKSVEEIQALIHKSEQYDKAAKRAKDIGTRLRIKTSLLIAKARKAGITVSKEEVDREMKLRGL